MNIKKTTRTLLLATTFMCSAAPLFAEDKAVVVTDQHSTSSPLHSMANAVAGIVNGGVNTVKKGAEVVTDTAKGAANAVVSTDDEVTKDKNVHHVVVGRHYHHHRGYLNGYKGYKYARPHYVRYADGWYYPQDAFKPVKLAADKVKEGVPMEHVRYCEARYRSYRASDNTFQPYHGSRQECFSRFYKG